MYEKVQMKTFSNSKLLVFGMFIDCPEKWRQASLDFHSITISATIFYLSWNHWGVVSSKNGYLWTDNINPYQLKTRLFKHILCMNRWHQVVKKFISEMNSPSWTTNDMLLHSVWVKSSFFLIWWFWEAGSVHPFCVRMRPHTFIKLAQRPLTKELNKKDGEGS